jgi:hypothetical protein
MLLLALLATPTTAVSVNTSTPCVPASCRNLTISYPFCLAGTHRPYCGYKAFQVTCEERKVYLKNSYWTYQILDISYENSSFVVTNVNLQEGGYCGLNLIGNAPSDLGAGPFKVSDKNRELFFVSDCQGQARQLHPSWPPVNCAAYDMPNSFAWLAGNYSPDDNPKRLPGNCTVASFMPVLGYQGAVAADYDRLMKRGWVSPRAQLHGRGLRAVRAERWPVLGRCRRGRIGALLSS